MTRLKLVRYPVLLTLLALGSLQCGENKTEPRPPTAIESVVGDAQTGPVGMPLASPLVVLVTDNAGDPVQGVTVSWSAQRGSVSPTASPTGSDGRASVQWTLGAEPGEQLASASASGLQGSPVTFMAIASDGQSPSLTLQTQPSTAAQTGVPFSVQPVVQLKDAGGNDLAQSGLDVTASLASGSGTLGGTLIQATDATGRATFANLSITGDPGSYTLQFTAPGANSTVSTPITLGGTAGSIAIITTPPVSALNAEVFAPVAQPIVQVKDASGSPVGGAQVTARVASGGGTLEGSITATTDAGGIASYGDLGISGTGSHTLEFTSGTASVTSSPVAVSALPAEAGTGRWGPVVDWGNVVPLHISLLPSGKVLGWGRNENDNVTMGMPRVWDPTTGPPTNLPAVHVDTMLFCAGHTLMPDGRLMVSGGHKEDDKGIKVTNFFSAQGAWEGPDTPDMAHGRWYPTTTVLPDGRVLTMGGRDENGAVVTTPEVWDGTRWIELTGAGTVNIPYYPRNFVVPDGRIFYAGERVMSRWFDVSGAGSWSSGPNHIWPFNRDYGTAVMYEPGKILVVGGGGNLAWSSQTPDARSSVPTATAEKIDLNGTSPVWQSAGSMSAPRRHLNSTILPNGQVLITGGTKGGTFVDASAANAVRAAEVWNPTTGQWTTLASNSKVRVYHSVSLLLPDGTVLHGASGYALDSRTLQEIPAERNHEIFFPPYLFKGARPSISSAPASVGYGATFSVVTPNAAQITEARWIRLGSVTHAFDMSQRANTFPVTRTSTGVEITAPANANLAPPGHYLLFILNRNGVPSEGTIVRVQ